nr:MAG TPA: hypothetical protein [Caudoviricetes sp.]
MIFKCNSFLFKVIGVDCYRCISRDKFYVRYRSFIKI